MKLAFNQPLFCRYLRRKRSTSTDWIGIRSPFEIDAHPMFFGSLGKLNIQTNHRLSQHEAEGVTFCHRRSFLLKDRTKLDKSV